MSPLAGSVSLWLGVASSWSGTPVPVRQGGAARGLGRRGPLQRGLLGLPARRLLRLCAIQFSVRAVAVVSPMPTIYPSPSACQGGPVSSIIALAGSPSADSRTVALTEQLAEWLRGHGHAVRVVRVRDLPAEALLGADAGDPAIAEVIAAVAEADGVIVASPVYKAAYCGVLKVLLDLLPHMVLAGKVVLPVLTGGGPVHMLALDYALRPVLQALGAHHVVPGAFVVDKHIERTPDGVRLAPEAEPGLTRVVDKFSAALT
ncbi:MAG TPA: NADPH-dependent FMN reductase [Actinophytocola sp.]|uniref:NADPH-dependent FMN reductase n=1 Tax=Actinophytocola sp. TaxID=1872138 RepID=UPI002DDD47B8|nr:NADPH-dependent FMN reductase [Actinophytocola sp.]HEV2778472.1 NADPH-dependent FMN reductase [Actinophytocola sp.]